VTAEPGIGLAVTSGVFLLISEHTELFGFREYGYRTAIIGSFVAEGATVIFLGAYVLGLFHRRELALAPAA
jgi:hypothetical protein